MNNIKKIGLSALAGSLAMVSANAIEYNLSGGMLATFTTQDDPAGTEANNGRGLGVATDLTFSAGGELDNGFTVDYAMFVDTDGALSNTSSQMTVGMGSLGTLQLNNKGGSKANGIDDITPNAYNETWDGLTGAGTHNNPSFFGSSTASGSLDYRIPAQDLSGNTVNASVTYDPGAGVGPSSKGGVDGSIKGTAFTIEVANPSGFSVGAGQENVDLQATAKDHGIQRNTAYAKYAMGGVTVAYQEAYQDSAASGVDKNADKESSMFGIAYTSGDMTISYGESEVEVKAVGTTAALATIELTSIQAAYSMGAMTVSAAMSETDNENGVAAREYSENTLAVSFAF
jgi:outer membrane protein OmpU